MAARNHLRGYNIHCYGPGGCRLGPKKVAGLNVLSLHITAALRKIKAVTSPPVQEIEIGFREEPVSLEIFQRHPKTAWLYWKRDYRDLNALDVDADNQSFGEFAISIAEELQDQLRIDRAIVKGFPFEALERGIQSFRDANYSFVGKLTPSKAIDASELKVRFLCAGNCLETTVTIVFFLGRKELHRQPLMTFGGGQFTEAEWIMRYDVYDHALSFHPLNSPKLTIKYDDLPLHVRKHLPTNAQLHAEWGTPYNPANNSKNYLP